MRMTAVNVDSDYIIDGAHMRRLAQINEELYADQPLLPARRRDLANALDAVLSACSEVKP